MLKKVCSTFSDFFTINSFFKYHQSMILQYYYQYKVILEHNTVCALLYWNAILPVHSYTGAQYYQCTDWSTILPAHTYTRVQYCKCTILPEHSYTGAQHCQCTLILEHNTASAQTGAQYCQCTVRLEHNTASAQLDWSTICTASAQYGAQYGQCTVQFYSVFFK